MSGRVVCAWACRVCVGHRWCVLCGVGVHCMCVCLVVCNSATLWCGTQQHCDALHRPLRERHPDATAALIAKVDLLTAGVAVDDRATAQSECDARKVYEKSPWATDKGAAEVIRPALVQTADQLPLKSVARDMAYATLQSRILSAAEAAQAAKLHHEMPPRATSYHA